MDSSLYIKKQLFLEIAKFDLYKLKPASIK
jgi:hypothetical protein